MRGFVPIQTFFRSYIQRKFILYGYINRTSPEFQSMHAYDQQSWFLFHRCRSFFSFWTAENRSYRNHQMKLIIIGPSRPKENQNTVEKNEFYEWEIWRTIMRTMNENSFICIKINSWFSTKDPASTPFYHRPRTDQFFQQLASLWSDLIRSNEDSVSIPFYHRFHTDQHFNSWPSDQMRAPPVPLPTTDSIQTNISTAGPFWSNGGPVSTPSYHRLIQVNLFNSWPPLIKWGLR